MGAEPVRFGEEDVCMGKRRADIGVKLLSCILLCCILSGGCGNEPDGDTALEPTFETEESGGGETEQRDLTTPCSASLAYLMSSGLRKEEPHLHTRWELERWSSS